MPSTETDRALRTIRRAFRAYGVPRDRRDELVADLEAELLAVAADGGGAAVVLGTDPEALAAELADAHGFVPVRPRVPALVACATGPIALVALATYVLVGGGPVLGLPFVSLAATHMVADPVTGSASGTVNYVDSPAAALGIYGAAGLLALLLASLAVAAFLRLRRDACVGLTVRQLLVLLPPGALVGCGVAVAVGAATDFSTAPAVVAWECATVWLVLAAATRVARLRARRRWRGLPQAAPASR